MSNQVSPALRGATKAAVLGIATQAFVGNQMFGCLALACTRIAWTVL